MTGFGANFSFLAKCYGEAMPAKPSSVRLPCTYVRGFTIPGTLTPCRFHHHGAVVEIVYHPTGAGLTKMSGETALSFVSGDVIIYPPHLGHDQILSTAGMDACLHLHVDKQIAERLREGMVVRGPQPAWLAHELSDLAQAQSITGAWGRRVIDHRASAVLIALLDGVDTTTRRAEAEPGQGLADQAAAHIAERFQHLGRLEDVAKALGVGYDPLRRAFRTYRGMSLVAWLTEVRLARAKELLRHSPLDQEDIARQCGYGSARYFSAVFSREVGVTPGVWRRGG